MKMANPSTSYSAPSPCRIGGSDPFRIRRNSTCPIIRRSLSNSDGGADFPPGPRLRSPLPQYLGQAAGGEEVTQKATVLFGAAGRAGTTNRRRLGYVSLSYARRLLSLRRIALHNRVHLPLVILRHILE